MNGFFNKRLDDINYEDIKDLIENRISESYDLDYKEAYPSNKTLAKLMIGFANSNGGYIIIGVQCEEDTNFPKDIVGIERGEHSTKITQIAYSNSQPHIWPKIKRIPHIDNDDRDVVVIKVGEAVEPIMFTQGNKFPIRINDKIEYADQPLVRKLFSRKNISDQIEHFSKNSRSLQESSFNLLANNDTENRYILIGFTAYPFYKGDPLIDLADRDTEIFINGLYRSLTHRLYEHLDDFDNYIRDFNYMGDYFLSRYNKVNNDRKISSDFRIYQNGAIYCSIIYLARKGLNLLESSRFEYNESIYRRKVIEHSAYLYYQNLPALLILFIRLYRIIHQDKFNGKITTSLRFLTSQYKIIINTSEYYLTPSNSNDFTIKKSMFMRDLDNRQSFHKIINEIISELLRYFGFEINRANSQLQRYQDTINWYLNSLF